MNLLQFAVLVLLHHHVSPEGEICGAETERPRDLACLRKLWREAGCYPYGAMAPDNRDVRSWYSKGIRDVRNEMAQLNGMDCYGTQNKNVPPVSIGNPATQSSTYAQYVATIASRAEYNCYRPPHHDIFTHTLNTRPRWWSVDLQSYHLVDTVRIIARDRAATFLGSYGIYVRQGEDDTDDEASRCSRSTVADTALTCDVRREGTHVRLLREDSANSPVCLCKLIVYGYPSCGPDDKTGPHTMACLRKLWNDTGCDVTDSSSPDNINVDFWNAMNVRQVKESMASITDDGCRNSSFNISGLDAVSIGKPATQSSRAASSGDEYGADLASVAENNCYGNALSPSDQTLTSPEVGPWWSLDLEAYFRVSYVRIIARRDGTDDWLGTYNVTVGHPSWAHGVASVCQTEITGNDVMIRCPDTPMGASVRIKRTEPVEKSLALCKVIVHGQKACPVGKFNWPMCQNNCSLNCKGSRCDLNSGDCVDGCVAGKRGSKCQEDCLDDTWGENCKQNCSVGCSATCDKVDGRCSCSDGFYGSLCLESCSQNCQDICDKSTGFCQCKPGYQLQNCTQVCDQGRYGDGCSQQCSNGCTSPCNHVNGTCSCIEGYYQDRCDARCALGCQGGCQQTTGNCQCRPGYTYKNCSSECLVGTYGKDCLSNCSMFCWDPGVCDHVTGYCPCQSGYSGDRCNEVCRQGWYGDGCGQQCSAGCTSPCNHVTGTCSCQEGYYLDRCDGRCAAGCQSGCHQTTGYCQCRPGYTNMNCTSECPGGTYGKDCLSKCSVYCKDPDVCDHVTGRCSCKDGYAGEKCDAVAVPLGAIIGGTIGGVVFLVLVVLLAIILLSV